MTVFAGRGPLVRVDRENHSFSVARRSFIDPAILEAERERIFGRCWLYLGHESELVKPGDFVTRQVGGRQVIFAKTPKGEFSALLNTCAHRGARVCRERSGNAKSFQCFYHGWIFGLDGQLRHLPDEAAYPADFKERPSSGLKPVPRFERYRGFAFVCFDENAVPLTEYLGGATEYIDIVADQSEAGMTVVGGTQEYSIRANWKLLAENSYDGYHAATNHATYLDYLRNTNGGLANVALSGEGRDLGNGHAVVEYKAPWGRPVAQWIPMWGEQGQAEIDATYARLVDRHGKERADRIATRNRNLVIFPNLVINDIMAVTIRTFYPVSTDYMQINAWALAPSEESAWAREYRLFNFLEFLGPGGFATPDDIEALEQCQRGYANAGEVGWNDISKGMNRTPPAYDDEAQMRAFWTQWNHRIADGAAA